MSANEIFIREATSDDFEFIWEIFHSVVKTGDTYAYFPNTTKEEAFQFWMTADKVTFVAILNAEIVGTYFLKSNQPGLGSHVANAAYMVHPKKHGYGIGKKMAEHSLGEAKKQGYNAMQFNFVVSTNEAAVKLWKKMGFDIIGTAPKGFNHTKLGYVDTYIMHRFL